MWRVLHAMGWVLAMGLSSWLLAMLAYGLYANVLPQGDGPAAVAHGGGALLGIVAGLLLARATWRPMPWHAVMAHAGAWIAVIAGVVGGWFLMQARARAQQGQGQWFAGFGEFLVGLLAFAIATIGLGLGLAGISGRFGHRAGALARPSER